MKVESSIKENYSSTTIQPLTKTEEIIQAICEWNGITVDDFRWVVWNYSLIGKDDNGENIYAIDDNIINPIGMYLMRAYDWKEIVFEKWKDKFFGTMKVRSGVQRYMLGEKVIQIPFTIRAENEDTGEWITIFPKTSDILQPRMKNLYVVNNGWAERQRIEKEIMAKLIELSQVRWGNEILSTQNAIEELKAALKKRWIEMELTNGEIFLDFSWRTIRDTANSDDDYIAPPITVGISFDDRRITCRGYSPHWFGTPNSWWNPCWWNRDREIHNCLQDCNIKELINLVISWAYGYNSEDTTRRHEWRHPLAKLRDYIWWVYDNRGWEWKEWEKVRQGVKENLAQIKHDLNIDNWLQESSGINEFLSSLENDNEKSE